METITIAQIAEALKFKCLTPEIDATTIEVHDWDVNRPALQLAGFYDHFDSDRVQIVGNVECAYLASLDAATRRERVKTLFSKHIPCLIYCRNHKPSKEALELASTYNVPLYLTNDGTSDASEDIIHYLKKIMAPMITIHGVLVDVYGEGVLITGESGIGKSEAALELVKRGHRLIADDAVEIRKLDEENLIGSAPEVTKDFVELRGVGIIDVKALFGVQSVKNEQKIDFIINIEEWNKAKEYDRLGNDDYYEILGNSIMRYSLPLRPGRNLAVIVEAAAVNYRQRSMGFSAKDELCRRVNERLMRGDSEKA